MDEARKPSAVNADEVFTRVDFSRTVICRYDFPAYINGTESLANPMWLVLSFLIVVLGELCLSPVGLSATSKLAPAAFSAQTMSLWFLSNASAQAINAQIVRFTALIPRSPTSASSAVYPSCSGSFDAAVTENSEIYEGC
ncbi:hypothetical protein PO124_34575 [Bacillus licheniformis]|nr:hypothetical protein [Bacillus licheniformis]